MDEQTEPEVKPEVEKTEDGVEVEDEDELAPHTQDRRRRSRRRPSDKRISEALGSGPSLAVFREAMTAWTGRG